MKVFLTLALMALLFFAAGCKKEKAVVHTVYLYNPETSKSWSEVHGHYIFRTAFSRWENEGDKILLIVPAICDEEDYLDKLIHGKAKERDK